MKWLVFGVCLVAVVCAEVVHKDQEQPDVADDKDIPLPKQDPWVNGYDQQFKFRCPRGRGLTGVRSQHHNWYEDRQFAFTCERNYRITSSCSWSGYVNSMRKYFDWQCPHGKVMAGVESYHQNGKEDREFNFLCCRVRGGLSHCGQSGYVNNYDKEVNYGSGGKFITGWRSKFSWWHKDRKFSFRTCEISSGRGTIGK